MEILEEYAKVEYADVTDNIEAIMKAPRCYLRYRSKISKVFGKKSVYKLLLMSNLDVGDMHIMSTGIEIVLLSEFDENQ